MADSTERRAIEVEVHILERELDDRRRPEDLNRRCRGGSGAPAVVDGDRELHGPFLLRPGPECLAVGRLHRFALERGYLDAALNRWVVRPFTGLFRWIDAFERRVTTRIAGRPRAGDEPTDPPEVE